MFNGIIKEIGTIVHLSQKEDGVTITVNSPATLSEAEIGDSIAVNGTCLTVTSVDGTSWTADVVAETLRCTSLGDLKVNDQVNLERPLRPNGFVDGHFVQGHVDAVGTLLEKKILHDGSTAVTVSAPPHLMKYIVKKGSIAVDGVSLTVSDVHKTDACFTFAMIPLTGKMTTLGWKSAGQKVNLEVDILGKYIENFMNNREG